MYVTYGKTDPEELGRIATETVFKLLPEEAIEHTDEELKIPEGLIVTFLSISYSTTRGAFAVKAADSVLGKAPLPLVDPKKLIKSSQSGVEEGAES